jgi:DNA-binding winged helix-turn-helix (wHTH) protein
MRWPTAPAPAQFDPGFGLMRPARVANTDKPLDQRVEAGRSTAGEISFGLFRLFPTQFLLLEGDQPVPLGSRALQILIALLERPREVVSKQDLMDRVWPNIFVSPANLTVHMSALRRTLRDGQAGNRFIINIPGRGYSFVADVTAAAQAPSDQSIESV